VEQWIAVVWIEVGDGRTPDAGFDFASDPIEFAVGERSIPAVQFAAEAERHALPLPAHADFVMFMCSYAADVQTGVLLGPYTDVRVRRYARAALIPRELLERTCPDPERTSRALGIPVWELTAS
jgi:hypothetical protein